MGGLRGEFPRKLPDMEILRDWSTCFTNRWPGEVLERVKWEGAGRGL